MESNFFLKIKSAQMHKEFTLQRNKDVIQIGIISVLTRVGSLLCSIISFLSGLQTFTNTYFYVRTAGILWNVVILLLAYYFPFKMSRFTAALIMPSFLINLIYLAENPTGENLLSINVSAFTLLLIDGILLNEGWILTSIGMIISCILSIVFYIVFLHLYDMTFYGILVSCVCLTIYGCYFFEKRLKL